MIAQLTINYNLCKDPLNCRKCLSICPSLVFACGATKVWKGRETDPTEYRIVGRYYDKCSGCGDCQKVCPNGAIKIEFVSREALTQKFQEERVAKLKGRTSAK